MPALPINSEADAEPRPRRGPRSRRLANVEMPRVAVFDVDVPPGVAFIRSLGRAGIPMMVGVSRGLHAGRFSRYSENIVSCPPVRRTDEFVDWLENGFANGSLGLVAPTSDYVTFCVSEALERLGRKSTDAGHADATSIRTCLFKNRFGAAMESFGFPTPRSALPTSLAEAQQAARTIGYPVVLKPRSHVGIGTFRGSVAFSPRDLACGFKRFPVLDTNRSVLLHDPDLTLPMIQRYHDLGTMDVVSLTGYLDPVGAVQALAHSRKLSQSPRRLGIGTMFEPIAEPSFAEAAVDAIRAILGTGVFELEVLVDRATGEYWAIDLNPRGFGQMSLDIALGDDLPVLWYAAVTGTSIPTGGRRRRPPQFWHDAVSSYTGFGIRFARGPGRTAIAEHAFRRARSHSVGAMFDWHDPAPGLVFGLQHFRHPRALIRSFLFDTEVPTDARRNGDGCED